MDTGRDGGVEKAAVRAGIGRRRRDRVDRLGAQMGSSLQGRLGLGWRAARIQLAPAFNSDRFYLLARNG